MNPIPLVTIARDDVVYFCYARRRGWLSDLYGSCESQDADNPMTSSSRWTSKFTTGWRMVDEHPGETSGWPGCMEKRHDILRKASPRLKETEEYFMPGSLPVQPHVTMGSGLVDLSGDYGWDGASRCRTMVGLDEHRTVVRGTLRKTMFRSSCSQTP